MKIKRVKSIAIVIATILLLYGSVRAVLNNYYSERDQIRAHLESIPNVEIINIYGRDDFFRGFNVRYVDIRLKDHPESYIGLAVPAHGILKDSGHIFLSDIGPWTLGSDGYTYIDSKDKTTGESMRIRTECGYGSIDIGSASPVADQIPFDIKNIEDVISHYSELEAFFAQWPDRNRDGELIPRTGNLVKCYLPKGCF